MLIFTENELDQFLGILVSKETLRPLIWYEGS